MAAETVTVTQEPDGHQVGPTTKAASTWSANGATIGGAVGFIITYILVKSGFEEDPATSVAVGGALSFILIWVGGKLAGLQGGKRTPTDQYREYERVTVQQVDKTDPELKAAIVSIAAEAGLISKGDAEAHVPNGEGSHRAEPVEADESISEDVQTVDPADVDAVTVDTVVDAPEEGGPRD